MTIFLNQKEHKLEPSTTLTCLLKEHNIKPEGIAIALNNRIVKRDEWESTTIEEGAKITLIQATYGG